MRHFQYYFGFMCFNSRILMCSAMFYKFFSQYEWSCIKIYHLLVIINRSVVTRSNENIFLYVDDSLVKQFLSDINVTWVFTDMNNKILVYLHTWMRNFSILSFIPRNRWSLPSGSKLATSVHLIESIVVPQVLNLRDNLDFIVLIVEH